MGENLGQPVVVENRPGGGSLVAIRAVKAFPPDGYTLLAAAPTIAIQPAVMLDPGYDLLKDFVGVGTTGRSAGVLLVGPKFSDKTFADFVASAKKSPGKYTYASAGIGSSTHIGAAMVMQTAGVDVMHVPYKGNSAAWPDVISGRVSAILEATGSGAPKVRDGMMRALAVTSTARSAALPDIPTVAEQGFPNFSYYIWFCFVAPAGTSKDVVKRLNDALRVAQSDKAFLERLRTDGAEPMVMSPEKFDAFLKKELTTMNDLATALKIEKR